VVEAGVEAEFNKAMDVSAALYGAMAFRFPEPASYAVSLAYRLRFVMQMNAREAMHLIELRTTPQGHPSYRVVAQEMHRLIGEHAGHRAIAAAMKYADHSEVELERLKAEREREGRAKKKEEK
jgi:thymidylate synthase ThyX